MALSKFSLEGRVAIVTGAGGTKGIGRATAVAFAEAGADVAVCDINVKGETFDLEDTAEEVRKRGRRSLAVQADVTKESDVAALVKEVVKELNTVDILANVAGYFVVVPFQELNREQWDKAMDINLRSQFICCQEVSKVMIEQKRGSIINWVSLSAYKLGSASAYGIAKIGTIALTAWAARELAPYNIRVNGVTPGNVNTDLIAHGISSFNRPAQGKPEQAARMAQMPKAADPSDIADVAVFLASDASRIITGQVIMADGGIMLM
jgi:NAD(P)-dependent dehydrogenase (short-subunit alcohol dehydrogenase family)